MQRQRRSDTAPEVAVRRLLWARGLRYRVDERLPLPGRRRRADLLFRGPMVAVFVDGCFWHSCPEHGSIPKSNRDWWLDKLHANHRRDRETDAGLADLGWVVLRVWEHEDPVVAATRIEAAVRTRTTART